jgi:hypothetical protein
LQNNHYRYGDQIPSIEIFRGITEKFPLNPSYLEVRILEIVDGCYLPVVPFGWCLVIRWRRLDRQLGRSRSIYMWLDLRGAAEEAGNDGKLGGTAC